MDVAGASEATISCQAMSDGFKFATGVMRGWSRVKARECTDAVKHELAIYQAVTRWKIQYLRFIQECTKTSQICRSALDVQIHAELGKRTADSAGENALHDGDNVENERNLS